MDYVQTKIKTKHYIWKPFILRGKILYRNYIWFLFTVEKTVN